MYCSAKNADPRYSEMLQKKQFVKCIEHCIYAGKIEPVWFVAYGTLRHAKVTAGDEDWFCPRYS